MEKITQQSFMPMPKLNPLIDEDDNLRLEIESIKRKLNNLWITLLYYLFIHIF